MDTVDVVPGVGVGPVRLGMARTEVHAALGPPPQLLPSAPGESPAEAWNEGALRVHYSAAGTVERVELSPGPSLRVLLEGREVSTTRVSDLVKDLYARARYEPNDPELGYRFHFPGLGLTLRRVKLPQGPNDMEGRFFTSVTLGRPLPRSSGSS
jgi:hypothetical protein